MITLAFLLCVTNAPLTMTDDATTAPPPPPPSAPAPAPGDAAPAPSSTDAAPASPAPPSDATSTPPSSSSPDVDLTTAPQPPASPAPPSASTPAVAPATATATTTTTATTTVERSYPGVIGWTGIAIGASGLVVASAAGTYAAVMTGIEGDPTSTRDDKQLAFDTHGVAGTIALMGLGATTIGALVFAADFAAPQ